MAAADRSDWADACLRIIDAGVGGADRVFALLVGAACRLAGADGAAVVSWQPAGPRRLSVGGGAFPLPVRRLPEGTTAGPERCVASVLLQGDTDLVVWWTGPDRPLAGAEAIVELRLLATLAATAVRPAGPALSSLYGVARRLLASRDREEVLLGLATAAADVLRSEIAGVFLATPDGAAVEAEAVVGNRSVETARLRMASGESMLGHVFRTGEIYRVDDWATDPVTSKDLLPIAAEEGTQSCIGAPMQVDGTTVGVLAAWRRRRSIYTDDDVTLIGTLADLAALGVQRALADERLRVLSDQLLAANGALSQRYEEASHALQIHRRLMRVVADGADLAAVVDALGAITDQEITFLGVDGTVVGAQGWLTALLRAGPRRDATELGEEAALLGPDGGGRHAIAVPVRSAGRMWGRLAVATRAPAATRDVVAAEQAALAGAVLLSQQDAIAGAARRLESEFVWDLLDGRISDEGDALVRSRQLARMLPVPARVVALSAEPRARRRSRRAAGSAAGSAVGSVGSVGSAVGSAAPERIERLRTELTRRAAQVLAEHGVRAPMGRRGDTLALIIPDRPPGDARRIAESLCALGAELDRELSAGVSATLQSIGQYPVAARQASYAQAATRPPSSPVVVFEDLGAVQFLLDPAHGEDLDRYAEQQLGVLIGYDRDHDADLVNTLRAYLDCDGHVQRAAAALHIHPKTMSYRLGRIEALTGMVVSHQEDRFNAQLALKILAIRRG